MISQLSIQVCSFLLVV